MWRSRFSLRLGDLDGLGHLTASAYLMLFEETRAAWMMERLGVEYPTYVVAQQQIEYLHEITLNDGPVAVELVVADIRSSSFDVREQIGPSGRTCARSSATLVMWDVEQRRSRKITPDERAVLETTAG